MFAFSVEVAWFLVPDKKKFPVCYFQRSVDCFDGKKFFKTIPSTAPTPPITED